MSSRSAYFLSHNYRISFLPAIVVEMYDQMYRMFRPHPALQPYIESYWTVRAPAAQPMTLAEQVFVDGRADILFNFGVAYQRQPLHLPQPEHLGFSNLDGQRNYPLTIAQYGEINLIGVRFCTGGLAAFLPLPVGEVSNLTVDVSSVWGAAARELEGRLYEASSSVQTVTLLDDFFLKHLNPSLAYHHTRQLAQAIDEQKGSLPIQLLSRESGYSIRTIDRLFRQYYGMTPKFYARIVRFQRALALLSRHPDQYLTQIALLCGYYDHAHFTHQFAAFTGSAPDQYRDVLRARLPTPPPNLAQYSQQIRD